jgi:hypothetical protein
MHFAAADETYDSTWFTYKSMTFVVDIDKPLETQSTVSTSFTYNFLAINYALLSGSFVQSHP